MEHDATCVAVVIYEATKRLQANPHFEDSYPFVYDRDDCYTHEAIMDFFSCEEENTHEEMCEDRACNV